MQTGMLWFDNDKGADVAERIQRAVAYYRGKYNQEPNLCFVNPKTLADAALAAVGSIEVRSTRSVLPNHFWIGVKTNREAA